jgi:uncharacterized protein
VLANLPVPINAVVLESMYPTIEQAVADRLVIRLGSIGAYLAPVFLWQIPLRTGVSINQLRPINQIAKLNIPLLIASGSEDRHTTLEETKRIFQAANEPKLLWVVQGAAHINLHAFEPRVYEEKILGHFAKH